MLCGARQASNPSATVLNLLASQSYHPDPAGLYIIEMVNKCMCTGYMCVMHMKIHVYTTPHVANSRKEREERKPRSNTNITNRYIYKHVHVNTSATVLVEM